MADVSRTLRVGLLAPVHQLDPRGGRDFVSSTIVEQVFETPFAPPERPDQPAIPALFSQRLSSEVAGRVLTAPVREGVRFSDGTPLTAEILADALRSTRLAGIKEIEAIDGRVVFRFAEAPARFDHTLTHRYCEIGIEKDGEILGTGPYRIAKGSTPERIRLVVNPEHRKPPEIEELLFVSYPPDENGEPTALLNAINAGEVEFSNVLSREQIAQLKGVRKWLEPGSGTAILYFNTERPAVADVRVRRALALAIDRAEIARSSHQNPVAFTATGLLPPMLGSWRDGFRQDVKQANLFLGQVGDDRPERLSLLLIYGPRPYLPNPRAVTDLLAERFRALGIELDVRQAPTINDYFRELGKGDYDLALSGWVADTADPADFLHALLSPEAIPSSGRRIVIEGNLARWKSDEVKEALARYRKEPSEAHKNAVLEPVRQEVPLLPLMYGPTIYVYSQRLGGFKPSPLGIPRFAELSVS